MSDNEKKPRGSQEAGGRPCGGQEEEEPRVYQAVPQGQKTAPSTVPLSVLSSVLQDPDSSLDSLSVSESLVKI